MHKLKGSRVYLSGPIDDAKDLGVGWRRTITPFLKSLGVIVVDPTDKPINIQDGDIEHISLRQEYRDNKDYAQLSRLMHDIRVFDLRCTDLCDWSIVYLNYDIIMTGTLEEVFNMNRCKKPIVVYCEQGVDKIPDWLFGTLPHQMFFDDWHLLYKYINDIDTGINTEYLKRWLFFDYNHLNNCCCVNKKCK
jgi:hypothetical protein